MALTDGRFGTNNFQSGEWQGFEGEDLDVVIDLVNARKVNKISTNFLHNNNVWIFLPKEVEFYTSADGKDFKKAGSVINDIPAESLEIIIKNFSVNLNEENVKYIRVAGKSIGKCPAWHKGAGGKAWIFVDEVTVE
jgi:hexosaminidase